MRYRFVARYAGRKLERARDLFEQVFVRAPAACSHFTFLTSEFGVLPQAIAAAPPADTTVFYLQVPFVRREHRAFRAQNRPILHGRQLQYAALEEKYGLARHAMTIYERATTAVPPNDRLRMYAHSDIFVFVRARFGFCLS